MAIIKKRPLGKVHTTVHIRRDVLEKLNERVAALHLRRDMVLNNTLDEALPELKKIRAAPLSAGRINSLLRRGNSEMVKLGLVLDKDVAKQVTASCKEKNVSRDAFIERTMELLIGDGPAQGSPLGAAKEILEDPIRWIIEVAGSSADLYGDLSIDLSDLLPDSTRRKRRRK